MFMIPSEQLTVLTWNVNGIRTVVPKNGDVSTVLDALNADIICFQETKSARDQLWSTHATAQGWHAYFAFCKLPRKESYSGVATFVRDGIETERATTQLSDEDFFGHSEEMVERWSLGRLAELDKEGRCVATDHGVFVLLNLYCPALATDDPLKLEERMAFKQDFHELVSLRCNDLIKGGREVIVVGDLNVSAQPIDSCDPGNLQEFWSRPHRQWMKRLCGEKESILSDTFRQIHPARTQAYTCWNTASDARRFNHGTRLDYVLASTGLSGLLLDADICPEVEGSDHCPIFAQFRNCSKFKSGLEANPVEEKGNLSKKICKHTKLCTCFYPEFAHGRQQKVSSFFQPSTTPIKLKDTSNGNGESFRKRKRPENQQSYQNSVFKQAVCNQKETKIQHQKIKPTKKQSTIAKQQSSLESFFKTPKGSKPTQMIKWHTPSDEILTSCQEQMNEMNGSNVKTPVSLGTESCDLSSNDTLPTSKDNQKTSGANSAVQSWRELMKPKTVIVCLHGEPAVERIVKKPGPNKDRRFYVCTKPAGDYTTNKDARCDFFQWKRANSNKGLLKKTSSG